MKNNFLTTSVAASAVIEESTLVGQAETVTLTFENALETLPGDIKEYHDVISELDDLSNNVEKFNSNEVNDIETGELTHESALLHNVLEKYKNVKQEGTTVLGRALEYFMELLQKAINFLRTILLKQRVIRSKHTSMAEKYTNTKFPKIITGDPVKYISLSIPSYIAADGILSKQLEKDISDTDTMLNLIEGLSGYAQIAVAQRPGVKVMDTHNTNNKDSVQSSLVENWIKASESAWYKDVVKPYESSILNKTIARTIISDRYESVDLNDRSLIVPITTDGNQIISVTKGEDRDLRMVRSATITSFRTSSKLNISNMQEIMQMIASIDLKSIVESDIKAITVIEKNAKAFYKTTSDLLKDDKGRRNVNFNTMITTLNIALEQSNNRLKLINNVLSVAEKLEKERIISGK